MGKASRVRRARHQAPRQKAAAPLMVVPARASDLREQVLVLAMLDIDDDDRAVVDVFHMADVLRLPVNGVVGMLHESAKEGFLSLLYVDKGPQRLVLTLQFHTEAIDAPAYAEALHDALHQVHIKLQGALFLGERRLAALRASVA